LVADGITHVDQPRQALAALRQVLAGYDPFTLAALHVVASITGSLVLALAVAEGEIIGAQAFALSRIDETYQAEKWGEDAEAAKRATALAHELDKAVELMIAVR
jgi:chaperone required for assembly of F1-ATPase